MKVELVLETNKKNPLPQFEVISENTDEFQFLKDRKDVIKFIIKSAVKDYKTSEEQLKKKKIARALTLNDVALDIWENVRRAFESYTIPQYTDEEWGKEYTTKK